MFFRQKKQPNWIKYAGCVFLAIWIGGFSYRYIDPASRKDRAILSDLSRHEIMSVTIEPARNGYATAVNRPIVIGDRSTIDAISEALSKMSLRNPEHPKVTRAVILRIQLRDRVIGGPLQESSNDGTTFYCMSNVTTGWVLGTYSVPGGHAVFDEIAKLASTSSTASQAIGVVH